jgi:glycine hydroxymethyltransferase
MHVIAAKAVAFREALAPAFTTYQAQVLTNAQAMATRLTERGFRLVSGGTDNHLMLIDLSDAPYSGKDAEAVLGSVGITVNKNTVPNEKRSPFVTSGIRVGTPAMTTRGLTAVDAARVADLFADALEQRDDAERLADVRAEVHALCGRHPVPA